MRIVLSVKVTSFVSVRILSLFRSIEIGKPAVVAVEASSPFELCARLQYKNLDCGQEKETENCKKFEIYKLLHFV